MHKNEMQRVSLLLDTELIRKADQAQELAGVSSRNQFVGKAIEHYLAELTATDNSNALTELLSSAIEKATENTYSKVSSALFRYAVFVDMMMRIVGEKSMILRLKQTKNGMKHIDWNSRHFVSWMKTLSMQRDEQLWFLLFVVSNPKMITQATKNT